MENSKGMSFSLNAKLCKSCGICYTLCPKDVFEGDKEGKPVVKKADSCIYCMLCEVRCPDFAIRMGRKENE